MKAQGKTILLCSCEGTMPLDGALIAKALGAEDQPVIAHHLCRSQLDRYKAALATGEPLVVACRQEAPLFREVADDVGAEAPIFVDIRDRAGWSSDAPHAAPKIAALINEALVPLDDAPAITLTSEGRVLVLGEGQAALDAAVALSAERSVELVLTGQSDELLLPMSRSFPIWRGKVVRAKGGLGQFEVAVTEMAGLSVSSRSIARFDYPQDKEVTLQADVVLDLGERAILPRRDGWISADAGSELAVEKAKAEILGLLGEFEKPRFIKIDPNLCAHSRNKKVACTRCMDACPSSAISPLGDTAHVDAHACGGHGACASACPTGAISYEYPANNGIYRRLNALLGVYHAGGGIDPILLVHDALHGDEIISAMARFGDGLPAHVLPFPVNAASAIGFDFLTTALAKGVSRVILLVDPRHQVDQVPLSQAVELANRVAVTLGYESSAHVVITQDPDQLQAAFDLRPAALRERAAFAAAGHKRSIQAMALNHLYTYAPNQVPEIALEQGAPFGTLVVDSAACTLCLACVGVCPANALSGHPTKPSIGLLESNCVQCGLCAVTCPEKAITLVPRLNFRPEAQERQVLKEEEPWCCTKCGKPFGAKSSIERMVAKLENHPMFKGTSRLDLIKMCEDCRVVAQFDSEENMRPMAYGQRPITRTSDDYKK